MRWRHEKYASILLLSPPILTILFVVAIPLAGHVYIACWRFSPR